MLKRVPGLKTPPQVKSCKDNIIRQTRRYKVITPLFGGGAEPQKPDAVTVVRGSEIRGQLRFWWRATRGGQFNGDLEAMRRAEEAIWGSAAAKGKPGPSPVSVTVESSKRGTELKLVTIEKWDKRQRRKVPVDVHIGHPSSPYSYVAFPLREEREGGRIKKAAGSLWKDVEFTLTIVYDLSKEIRVDGKPIGLVREVEAALWAWEIFGGVGARTRRGFGALQLTNIDGNPVKAPKCNEIAFKVMRELQGHVTNVHCQSSVPHLAHDTPLVITDSFTNAEDAWKYLFQKLRDFRQDRHASQRYRNRPGRSKWPEPDKIRRLTGTHHPDHEPQHPVHKFPRGQFGLPINFQFVRDDVRGGDPRPVILQSATSERFASRLILRPLSCRSGAVGVALILAGPKNPPDTYILTSGQNTFNIEVEIDKDDAQLIEPLHGEPDVLKAFLDTL